MQFNWQVLADNERQTLQFCMVTLKNCAMKITTIGEEAWQQLKACIQYIRYYIPKLHDTSYDTLWLNNHEVCQYLAVSEKTLWPMWIIEEIAYSKMFGQYYYIFGSMRDMLDAHAVQTNEEYIQELIAKGKSYISKGRNLNPGTE